jgi:hypothetical protein
MVGVFCFQPNPEPILILALTYIVWQIDLEENHDGYRVAKQNIPECDQGLTLGNY